MKRKKMNKSDEPGTKRPRPSVDSAPGILFTRFRENSVVIMKQRNSKQTPGKQNKKHVYEAYL